MDRANNLAVSSAIATPGTNVNPETTYDPDGEDDSIDDPKKGKRSHTPGTEEPEDADHIRVWPGPASKA